MLLLAPHWQARSRRRPVKGHLYRISSIDLARRPAAPPPSSPGRPPVMKLSPAFFFSCAVLVPPALVAAEPGPAVVRHAPAMSGRIEGSLQVLAAESISIREHAAITGDLLVPGRPELRRDRTAKLGGIADGTGAPLPDRHTVSLAERSSVGRLVRQTDAVPLPAVPPPPTPPGNRTVNLRNSRASPGDFATLRHLDLGEDLGLLPIPPGAYGNFSAADQLPFLCGGSINSQCDDGTLCQYLYLDAQWGRGRLYAECSHHDPSGNAVWYGTTLCDTLEPMQPGGSFLPDHHHYAAGYVYCFCNDLPGSKL